MCKCDNKLININNIQKFRTFAQLRSRYAGFADPTWNIRSTNDLKSKDFWFHDAQRTLYDKLTTLPNQYLAKNIIFFLGDGMSVPTVTAGRIYDGQQKGIIGERNRLEFEKFDYVGLSKVIQKPCRASYR